MLDLIFLIKEGCALCSSDLQPGVKMNVHNADSYYTFNKFNVCVLMLDDLDGFQTQWEIKTRSRRL